MSTKLVCNLFEVPELTSFEAFLVFSPNALGRPDGGNEAVCKRLGFLLRNRMRSIFNASHEDCYCAGGGTFKITQQYQATLDAIKLHYHRYELSFSLETTRTQNAVEAHA